MYKSMNQLIKEDKEPDINKYGKWRNVFYGIRFNDDFKFSTPIKFLRPSGYSYAFWNKEDFLKWKNLENLNLEFSKQGGIRKELTKKEFYIAHKKIIPYRKFREFIKYLIVNFDEKSDLCFQYLVVNSFFKGE